MRQQYDQRRSTPDGNEKYSYPRRCDCGCAVWRHEPHATRWIGARNLGGIYDTPCFGAANCGVLQKCPSLRIETDAYSDTAPRHKAPAYRTPDTAPEGSAGGPPAQCRSQFALSY